MKAQQAHTSQDDIPSDNVVKDLLGKSKRVFFFAALFSLAINLLMLALPIYSLQVLDRVISSRSTETLIVITMLVVVALCFYGMFTVIRTYILNNVCDWLDYKLAPRLLSDAIVKASLGAPVNASQYQRDLGTIKSFISGGGLTTLLDAPWSIIFIFVIYMINPVLGLLAVVGIIILVGFGVINEIATKKPIEKSSRITRDTQVIVDTAGRNAEAIESMGMMKNILNIWQQKHNVAIKNQQSGSKRSSLIQAMSRTIRMILQISVTGIGGYLALNNEMSVGGMIASSILVGRALAPFEGAINIWKSWIATREAYHRLGQNLKIPEAIQRGNTELPAPQGKVQVESLVFTPAKSAPVIKGINFAIAPGESLGVIGPSGAGKSTLSKLLVGLLPPTHGAVRLDDADTFVWNRESFGRYVGYLPQHVELFEGSIKDNIARMDVNAPIEDVITAAKKAGVHELVLRLPAGYDTECGNKNANLSPGQRQRIGMARALYGDIRFVVLDEPNSNLDGEGERALVTSLQRMKEQNITFIIVAHRPTIVSMVDKLLVLREGNVEKFGTRADIMRHYSSTQQAPTSQGGA